MLKRLVESIGPCATFDFDKTALSKQVCLGEVVGRLGQGLLYSQLHPRTQQPARTPWRLERVVGAVPSGTTTWLTGEEVGGTSIKPLKTLQDLRGR